MAPVSKSELPRIPALRLAFRDRLGLDQWWAAELFPPWRKQRPTRKVAPNTHARGKLL